MYLSIVGMKPLENYKLELVFENEEKRLFDFTPYLDTGIFSELQDLSLFKTVHVSFDTIEWSNGADLDPEVLYSKSFPITSNNIG